MPIRLTRRLPDDEEQEAACRSITFWRNGFSIEGIKFYSYADLGNEALLGEISTGRVPVSVLNVRPGQSCRRGPMRTTCPKDVCLGDLRTGLGRLF